jgi:hypothetical protein
MLRSLVFAYLETSSISTLLLFASAAAFFAIVRLLGLFRSVIFFELLQGSLCDEYNVYGVFLRRMVIIDSHVKSSSM